MSSKDEIYSVWAPPQALWSRWVKPVLFAFMDGVFEVPNSAVPRFDATWVPAPGSTAIVVDLPGEYGVRWGIEFARLGYRPIPLYNALPFPVNEKTRNPESRSRSTVEVEPILAALYRETTTLKQIPLTPEAPPVFLLDADRRVARVDPLPGTFDNRSVCFETDFPSGEFLLSHGIGNAIVLQNDTHIAGDLEEALLSWQRSGIRVHEKRPVDRGPAIFVVVERPSLLRRLWYRISVALGLRRGELGAFGRIVPSAG